MSKPHEAYGAVLILRVWFDSGPDHPDLRARIIHSADPTRPDSTGTVVAGSDRAVQYVKTWLDDYVAAARREQASRG